MTKTGRSDAHLLNDGVSYDCCYWMALQDLVARLNDLSHHTSCCNSCRDLGQPRRRRLLRLNSKNDDHILCAIKTTLHKTCKLNIKLVGSSLTKCAQSMLLEDFFYRNWWLRRKRWLTESANFL